LDIFIRSLNPISLWVIIVTVLTVTDDHFSKNYDILFILSDDLIQIGYNIEKIEAGKKFPIEFQKLPKGDLDQ